MVQQSIGGNVQTGRQTLQMLDKTLFSARNGVSQFETHLSFISESLNQNRQQQTQAIKRLAALRLGDIEQGNTLSGLDSADQDVKRLLKERSVYLQELEGSIKSSQEHAETLEKERLSALDSVDACGQALIDVETIAQSALSQSEAYISQLKVAKEAEVIAENAEEKRATAEQDLEKKGEPYRSSELFIYLWERHYGTPEYKANTLIRALDSWVAKLCEFTEARTNYWTLLEIPKRLAIHAESVRGLADSERDKLQILETKAAAEAHVPEKQSDLATAQSVLDDVDQRINKNEQHIDQMVSQRGQVLASEDRYSEQCIQTFTKAMSNKQLHQLQLLAERTLTHEDDNIVAELTDLQAEHSDLNQQVQSQRRAHRLHFDRLKQLEGIRQQFKSHRYDDIRSGFKNSDLIASMLQQFLQGAINSTDVWRTIERLQRHRNVGVRPDFGSGGLGRIGSRRNSTWHWPGQRSSGRGGFRLPSSGGFGTGGGFGGGGGFKTGGGF